MADSKKDSAKDTPSNPGQADRRESARTEASLARKIWQAGLGAYGRAIGETAHNVAKLTSETSKLFEDLAEKGAELERESGSPSPTRGGLFDRPPLEQRFQQLKSAFQVGLPASQASSDRIAELEAKVDAMRAEIASLADMQQAAKPAPKKSAPKKPAAAKKSAASKSRKS